jgi:DNA-binding transcriptional LysR family regulator
MPRQNISDLLAFRAVARERSFTRAAAQLGVSPSAVSHIIRGLEERLGVRLLTRTTRNVAPTDAGERLLGAIGHHFDEIEAGIAALTDLRDKPAGTIRLTCADHPAETLLWPALERFLPNYPDIHVEISVDDTLRDIVEDRFDAGVRLGEFIAKDMIAVPIGPDVRMAVVGSPAYFKVHPRPRTPHDLAAHQCINLRLRTLGGVYPWEFERLGRELKVRVEGQVAFNDARLIIKAGRAGLGLAYVFRDLVEADLSSGELVPVLTDWTPPFPGYHLYYPSRRQQSPAFALLVDALRYRA